MNIIISIFTINRSNGRTRKEQLNLSHGTHLKDSKMNIPIQSTIRMSLMNAGISIDM